MHFCRLLIFSKSTFSKIFQEYNQSVKQFGLRPDQARSIVWPGPGPNCSQRLTADNSIVGKELKFEEKGIQTKTDSIFTFADPESFVRRVQL